MTVWGAWTGSWALVGIIVPTWLGAHCARRRWFGTGGTPGLLVTVTATVLQLYVVAYVLGAVGWFRRWPYMVGCLAVGAGLVAIAGSRRRALPEAAYATRPDAFPDWSRVLAGAAVVAVLGQYVAHTLVSFQRGISDSDSLWYHAPVAARFVQEGWITRLYFVGGQPVVTYYPDNGELASAIAILPFHRDALLLLVNLGWLALALLSGWCLGQRYQRGPIAVASVALVASLPIIASRQAGTAGNDLTGIALLLAGAALLAAGDWRPPWLVLSGAMGGLGFGVKLSVMPLAVLLGLLVAVAAPAGFRRRSIACWAVPFAALGLYWPLRDWVRAGNPFPWIGLHLGPLHLPAIPNPGTTLHDTNVLYFAGHGAFWAHVFLPAMRSALGPGWPAVLLLTALGGLSVLVAGRDRLAFMTGVAGLVAFAVYTRIPNTIIPGAFIQKFFADTTRYAIPAVTFALVALAGSRLVGRPIAAALVTALPAALVVADLVPSRRNYNGSEWTVPVHDIVLGLVTAALIVASIAAAVHAPLRQTRGRLLFAALAAAVTASLWPLGGVGAHRYDGRAAAAGSGGVFAWGRRVTHSRIAVSGDTVQYPFFGPHLDNLVQILNLPGPRGIFSQPTTCASWRRAVDADRYNYLVLLPLPFPVPGTPVPAWVDNSPNALLVAQYPDGQVWKLLGPLDPDQCG